MVDVSAVDGVYKAIYNWGGYNLVEPSIVYGKISPPQASDPELGARLWEALGAWWSWG